MKNKRHIHWGNQTQRQGYESWLSTNNILVFFSFFSLFSFFFLVFCWLGMSESYIVRCQLTIFLSDHLSSHFMLKKANFKLKWDNVLFKCTIYWVLQIRWANFELKWSNFSFKLDNKGFRWANSWLGWNISSSRWIQFELKSQCFVHLSQAPQTRAPEPEHKTFDPSMI